MALKDSYVSKKDQFTVADELEEQRKAALLEEMGLEDRDTEKLRKMMLSPSEAVAAKTEELRDIRQHKGRKSDWEEFVDEKRRLGRVMHHSEFIRKLRTLVPNLLVERGGVLGCISLYNVRSTPVDEAPDYLGQFSKHFPRPVFIDWIHEGYVPEYTIDTVNDVQIPIAKKQGWRTVLLHMIARWNLKLNKYGDPVNDMWGRPIRLSRGSVFTEEDAHRVFGDPSNGPTASYYRLNLYNFRNAMPDQPDINKAYDPSDPRGMLR